MAMPVLGNLCLHPRSAMHLAECCPPGTVLHGGSLLGPGVSTSVAHIRTLKAAPKFTRRLHALFHPLYAESISYSDRHKTLNCLQLVLSHVAVYYQPLYNKLLLFMS